MTIKKESRGAIKEKVIVKDKWGKYVGKGIATVASAAICCYWAHLTKGSSGIGWFILSLMIIW